MSWSSPVYGGKLKLNFGPPKFCFSPKFCFLNWASQRNVYFEYSLQQVTQVWGWLRRAWSCWCWLNDCLPVIFRNLWYTYCTPSLQIRREPGATSISKLCVVHRDLAWIRGNSKWNQGQFWKYSSMLPRHNKVWTQGDQFSLIFILKTSRITPEGKFTADVRISVIYYIFVTYHHPGGITQI